MFSYTTLRFALRNFLFSWEKRLKFHTHTYNRVIPLESETGLKNKYEIHIFTLTCYLVVLQSQTRKFHVIMFSVSVLEMIYIKQYIAAIITIKSHTDFENHPLLKVVHCDITRKKLSNTILLNDSNINSPCCPGS